MIRLFHSFVIAAFAAVLGAGSTAFSDVVIYTVDPAQSSLTVSGTFNGETLQAQAGDSENLTTFYAGVITSDRDFAAGTLQITSAAVTAQDTNAVSPMGGSPAGYAFTESDASTVFAGAFIGFSFSISGPAVDAAAGFDPAQLSAAVVSGQVQDAIRAQGAGGETGGSVPMAGELVLGPGGATLTDVAGIETLTIPIETDFSCVPFGTSDTLHVEFSGTIVATTPTPEPTPLALLILPMFLPLCRRRQAI